MENPNILFITTDEQHLKSISYYGAQTHRTTSLDKLAESSDVYHNAYSVSPVCLPSRCSWMTGMYPHKSGSISNIFGASLSVQFPNLFTELKQEGYKGSLFGKCHFIPVPYPATRPDMTLEYEHFIAYYKTLGIDNLKLQDDKNNSLWFYDDYSKELERKNMLERCRFEAHENLENQGIYNFPYASDMHPDAWVGKNAVDYIRDCDSSQPQFIWTSFSGPHYPMDAPEEYMKKVDMSQDRGRIFLEDEWDDKSKYHHKGYYGPGSTEGSSQVQGGAQKEYSVKYWTKWRHHYYANVVQIDEWIGKIITAARSKFGENLYILFTSDHGEMMGNHSLWGKNGSLYEDVIRIPLMVCKPGQKNNRNIYECVSSIEFFPSILLAAGRKAPDHCDGVSLDEIVERRGRDYIVSECDNSVAIIKNYIKLVLNRYARTGEMFYELYDLQKDPHEFKNLYNKPAYAEKKEELMNILKSKECLLETVFYKKGDKDYWLNNGSGAGVANRKHE